jgi:adenylate kinase family enzyme
MHVSMRILITGASGAGTTTLGRALAARMGCAFFDADDYYWMPTDPPFQDKRDFASRLQSLLRDLGQSPAVIAGSIMNWGTELEESLSLVVFLTVPAAVRVARLEERELRRLGRVDPAFLAWAAQYDEGRLDGRSLQRHERWLAQCSCSVLRIDGDTSIRDRLTRVCAHVSSLDWRAAVL